MHTFWILIIPLKLGLTGDVCLIIQCSYHWDIGVGWDIILMSDSEWKIILKWKWLISYNFDFMNNFRKILMTNVLIPKLMLRKQCIISWDMIASKKHNMHIKGVWKKWQDFILLRYIITYIISMVNHSLNTLKIV